jgi:hypothetical protein
MNIQLARDIGVALIPLFFALICFVGSASLVESMLKPLKFSRHSPIVDSTQAIVTKITAQINVSRQSSTSDYVWTTLEYEYSVDGKTFKDSVMPEMFSTANFKDLYGKLTQHFPGQNLHVKVPVRMGPGENVIFPKLNAPFETYLSGVDFQGKHFNKESHIEVLFSKADPSLCFIPLFDSFDGGLIVKFFIVSAIAAFLIMLAFNGESSLPKLSFIKGLLLFVGISIVPAISPIKTPFTLLGQAIGALSDKTKTKFESAEVVFDQNATEQSIRQIIARAKQSHE